MSIQLTECRHYWVIEPALEQYSGGTCRGCGEQKTFTNFVGRQDYPDPRPVHESPKEELVVEADDEPDDGEWPVVQAYLRRQG